jgi:hypothetical protein
MHKEIPPLSELAQSIKLGIYKHYKGGMYKVLGIGRHTEENQELVIYQSLETNDIWIRPVEMFFEIVKTENYQGPRFIPREVWE